MATLTFLPGGMRADVADGETLFEAGRRLGIPIATACVGKGTCGLCRVKVVSGEAHLSPLNGIEKVHLGNVYFLTKLRLSCQARLVGDTTTAAVVVELPVPRGSTAPVGRLPTSK